MWDRYAKFVDEDDLHILKIFGVILWASVIAVAILL